MKKNIRVSRYDASYVSELPEDAFCANGEFAWEASIEPEDRSWILFVPKEGAPSLWVRVGTLPDSNEEAFAAAGSPEHLAFLAGKTVDTSNL